MSSGTLYLSVQAGEPLRTRAVTSFYLVKNYNLDVKISDPDEHYPSEFGAARVPAFRYPCGRTLTESVPVNLKLVSLIKDQGSLLGDGSDAQYAQIIQWMNIFNIEFMDKAAGNFCMVVGRAPYDAQQWDFNAAGIDRLLAIINDHLTKNTYLVGEKPSLADYYGVPMFMRPVAHLWDAEYRAKFPAVFRWFATVKDSPFFQGFFKDLEYAKEAKRPTN